MKQTIILTVILAFTLQSCSQNRDKSNNLFIEKYGNNNFDIFKNKSFLVRSFYEGNPVIYVFDYSYAHGQSKNSEQCGFVRVIISKKNNSLVSSSFVPQKDNCTMSYNQEEYYKLTTEFLQFDINSLSVDKDNNVFVKTTFYEGLPDLIQVNNQDSIKDFDQLVLIKDNWYKRQ